MLEDVMSGDYMSKEDILGLITRQGINPLNGMNEERFAEFAYAYKLIRRAFKDDNIKYEVNKPFAGMASIEIVSSSKRLLFADKEGFLEAKNYANNVEIYPLENGRVQVNLTFYGLKKRV